MPRSVPLLLLRWFARIASLASIGILAAFVFGEEFGSPNAREIVGLLMFPLGVVIGMALGWWREGLGGLVTAASLAGFYIYITATAGRPPGGPYFLMFSTPGLLFGVCWLLARWRTVPRIHSDADHGRAAGNIS